MHLPSVPKLTRVVCVAFAMCLSLGAGLSAARAEALLLVDSDSGRVLHADNAGYPWYPASITKIMTTYVTLRAVKEGRIRLDTLLTVSERALAQQPSKMGFPVGTQMTVDNALKMIMVKSANDIAVVLAEGVSGSVEAFANEMNQASQRLGMTQSSWVNPHGLPADGQVSSARDMAILARALIREFPQYEIYWRTPAIRFGRRVMRNYNKLMGRYPGTDGMKTGFICASGYNLVATATRGGKQLIAVVLGAPSGTQRNETAARLLEKGFNGSALSWLLPPLGSVDSIQPVAAAPPNLRDEICGKGRRNRTDHADEEQAQSGPGQALNAITAFASTATGEQESLLGPLVDTMPPIPVTVIAPSGAAATEALLPSPRKKKGAGQRKIKRNGKGRKSLTIQVEEKAAPAAGKTKATAKPKPEKPKAEAKSKAETKPKAAPKAAPQKPPAAKSKDKAAAAASKAKSVSR
ncbi:MAG TPA: D-alanyl-D-alanine carboxypeptidase family protein [Xanthobacteraceae bacterium]|nr:D-alanyl-D-alanine carboxypeptidase family protein [Xanthobacteraceae bacterium]